MYKYEDVIIMIYKYEDVIVMLSRLKS